MLLTELKEINTNPDVILHNIASHINGDNVRLKDCHSKVGSAIKSGSVKDSDLIVVLGQGSVGTHSVIVSDNDISVDSYKKYIKSFDPSNLHFSYYVPQDPKRETVWNLMPLKKMTVGEFKKKYL